MAKKTLSSKSGRGAQAAPLPEFEMNFQPQTIEHLGLRLYSSLPPVIGELVSNAWDADSPTVEVSFPESEIGPADEVIVADNGHGMTANELQEHYLEIGRNRREHTGRDTSPGGRRVTGRKGLGKLAVFGVADEIEVRTVKGGQAVCLRLNYPAMKAWPAGTPYKPSVVLGRTGETAEHTGTEVRIRSLRRRRGIDPAWVRRELARRFRFIGPDFRVVVNGAEIARADQRLREQCRKSWDVSELDGGGVVDSGDDWRVTGWIGILERSSQVDRGIDIYARGKAAELDSMFQLKTTHVQFARAYVVGEVNAEFLDETDDFIGTSRNSVAWESSAGMKLQQWGENALKDVFGRWLQVQREEKQERLIKVGRFDDWLRQRSKREQRIAQRLLKIIVEDETIEPESAGPLLEIVKSNVEFQAFQELVDEIEDSGTSLETLLRLFKDWRIVEARERLKIADGHLEVTEKLQGFINTGALEVQQIQPLFEENTWLIDPTWSEADGQTTYTKLLREQFPESNKLPAEERRLDILGITVGSDLHIVELKRPEKTLSRKDLEQIESYVDWAKSTIAGPGGEPRHVRGRLVVGKKSSDAAIIKKVERLAGDDIQLFTYRDLLQQARTVYGLTEKRLKSIAPEYSREARKSNKSKKKGTTKARLSSAATGARAARKSKSGPARRATAKARR